MSEATEQNESTDLVVIEKEKALEVFTQTNAMDPYLAKIKAKIEEFNESKPDLSTKKGRDAYASMAFKVGKMKNAIEKFGKDLAAEQKEIPKKIDKTRRETWDTLQSWQDEVRAPLTAWEQADEARVARHQASIDQMKLRLECRDLDVVELKSNIACIEGVEIGEHWEEFEAEAARVKDKALTALREALVIREKHEAELAAIAKFQAEQAERDAQAERDRIAQEAAERATREAEQRAQAERDAAARREAELIEQAAQQQRQAEQDKRDAAAAAEQARLNAELAEQRRIAAERQAELDRVAAEQRAEQQRIDSDRRQAEAVERAAAAERQRQADEQARVEAEAKSREKDRAHKGATLKAAKEAIMLAGINEEQAKAVVKLIAAGKVPAVSIQY